MKAVFLSFLLSVLALPALAQGDASRGIEATINRQIEAFQVDDFATAFTFASPSIQGMFGTSFEFPYTRNVNTLI